MISIIIVHYHVKTELFKCIKSIIVSKPKTQYEIIVIDNDESKTIRTDLKKRFPQIIYIPNKNRGFGQGNNIGAKHAKGKYLFFLNPDTKIYPKALDELTNYLGRHADVDVVAPLLYDDKKKPVKLQGARELTPLAAIFSFSFLNKLFPNNAVARKYWFLDKWNKKEPYEVLSVPGTAFMIRREIFKKIKGFDEGFFLYFEEHDLCKRLSKSGSKQVMLPAAKVYHRLGSSAEQRSDIKNVFEQSRFYYFKKHFGLMKALVAELILRINKYHFLLFFILLLGIFLRFENLEKTMIFIGDQGWFYLSARDMLLNGNIPFVGIESSHPWLHQGAYWTYILAGIFFISGYNPVNPAYFTAGLDVLTIFLLYKLASLMFSQRLGLIAAVLYTVSPLIIVSARMPYHTSPIPLFTILYIYFLYKWIKDNAYYFPLLITSLALLYNFEIATFLLTFVTTSVFLYGIIKKEKWALGIFNKKVVLLSTVGFLIPMLPMLIHDLSHNFSQTLKFLVWIGYRILVFLGYPPINPSLTASPKEMFIFFTEFYQKLIFPYNYVTSLLIMIASLLYPVILVIRKKIQMSTVLLLIITILTICGIYATKTPSGAYLPILFPGLVLLTAVFLDTLFGVKYIKIPVIMVFIVLLILNIHFLITHNYSFNGSSDTLPRRITIVKYIIKESDGKEYNLIGIVENIQMENFSKHYEYLAWWLGHEPSKSKKDLVFTVGDSDGKLRILKENK